MAIPTLSPADAKAVLSKGATLIDIRDADEHTRESIAGALNRPLAQIANQPLPAGPVIFHCRSGMRTKNNTALLQAAVGDAPCYLLEGGIDGWRACGLETIVDRHQPLEIMRQVQLAAGTLVLFGVFLGWLVDPAFILLSAFVGAGLIFAGVTGWCGMARLLRHLPWNRTSA